MPQHLRVLRDSGLAPENGPGAGSVTSPPNAVLAWLERDWPFDPVEYAPRA